MKECYDVGAIIVLTETQTIVITQIDFSKNEGKFKMFESPYEAQQWLNKLQTMPEGKE